MPAIDSCEPQMIKAFQKDGWKISQKPHAIRSPERSLLADISFQRQRNGSIETIIIIEVKCFANPENDLQEFYMASGQYNLYATALELEWSDLLIYLAVPQIAYERLLSQKLFEAAFQRVGVKLVIVDTVTEEIVTWIL